MNGTSDTTEAASASRMRSLAKSSLIAAGISWLIGLYYYLPTAPAQSLVPNIVVSDIARVGLVAAALLLGSLGLLEVGRRGTTGVLLYSLLGVGLAATEVPWAVTTVPDQLRVYAAGKAARDYTTAEAALDFQNLSNPNLLKSDTDLATQRRKLADFLAVAQRAATRMDAARAVLQAQAKASGPGLQKIVTVSQHLNARLELCRLEIPLVAAAAQELALLTTARSSWQPAPGQRDPTFSDPAVAQQYQEQEKEIFAAEQALAAAQTRIFGQATLHPGERVLSVQVFNPPRAAAPATPVAARALAPTAPVVDYSQLDFEHLADAVQAAQARAKAAAGEEASALQAWSAVLTNLLSAQAAVAQAAQDLEKGDVLNSATVAPGGARSVSDQFVARRGLANTYGAAVRAWESKLRTLAGLYLNEMYQRNLSPARAELEQKSLLSATPEGVKRQLELGAAEEQVAAQYNYTISAVEQSYNLRLVNTPKTGAAYSVPIRKLPWETGGAPSANPALDQAARELSQKLAKLQELQQTVKQLRQSLAQGA